MSSPSQGQPKSKTILVVEDERAIAELVGLVLSQETAYQTTCVSDGKEALSLAREVTPVLFLLDYQLPSMTGIQLYDQLHSNKDLETIPAIMMSANLPMPELEKRQIVPLAKPFDLDELLSLVDRVLES